MVESDPVTERDRPADARASSGGTPDPAARRGRNQLDARLEEIYDIALRTMDELFEFHHAIILLARN